MADTITMRFRFFGANKGKTKVINKHEFVDGNYAYRGSAEIVGNVSRYLSKFGAFAQGTDEYRVALALEEKKEAAEAQEKKEAADGPDNAPESDEEPGKSEQVQGDPAPAGEGAAEVPAPVVSTDNDAGQGGPELHPDGDGHENPGDDTTPVDTTPPGEVDSDMVKAVSCLDPDVDEHWNEEGQPSMTAIEEAYGSTAFAREDVEKASPGWTRAKAKELKELA